MQIENIILLFPIPIVALCMFSTWKYVLRATAYAHNRFITCFRSFLTLVFGLLTYILSSAFLINFFPYVIEVDASRSHKSSTYGFKYMSPEGIEYSLSLGSEYIYNNSEKQMVLQPINFGSANEYHSIDIPSHELVKIPNLPNYYFESPPRTIVSSSKAETRWVLRFEDERDRTFQRNIREAMDSVVNNIKYEQ